MAKTNIRQQITDQFIQALEQGDTALALPLGSDSDIQHPGQSVHG